MYIILCSYYDQHCEFVLRELECVQDGQHWRIGVLRQSECQRRLVFPGCGLYLDRRCNLGVPILRGIWNHNREQCQASGKSRGVHHQLWWRGLL
jgi:hypothetical protein